MFKYTTIGLAFIALGLSASLLICNSKYNELRNTVLQHSYLAELQGLADQEFIRAQDKEAKKCLEYLNDEEITDENFDKYCSN